MTAAPANNSRCTLARRFDRVLVAAHSKRAATALIVLWTAVAVLWAAAAVYVGIAQDEQTRAAATDLFKWPLLALCAVTLAWAVTGIIATTKEARRHGRAGAR